MITEFTTADPRVSGLARAVGTTVLYVTGGAIVPLAKYGIGNTDWCTLPQGGAATPTTSDPRTAGRAAAVGTVVMYVAAGAGVLLRKYGPNSTDWATVPVISGGGGGVSDGNKGDITVASAGSVWAINAGVIGTSRLGVDITTAGKALLDDTDAAAQRTTLGLGTAATTASTAYEAAGGIATHAAVTSSVHGITAFGATLVDDIDASAARTTLGLGTAATTAATAYEASGAVATHAALTTIHGISAFGATLVDDANAAAARTTLGLASVASSASAADITAGTLATARLGTGTANATTFLRGDQTWATPSGGGGASGASGTATLNFGAFPGSHETFVSVLDAGVVAGSVIVCTIRPEATADHSVDEHYAEAPSFVLVPQSITAGVGFDVWARYQSPVPEPLSFPGVGRRLGANATTGANTHQQPTIVPTVGGTVPRIYGQWTIQWIRI